MTHYFVNRKTGESRWIECGGRYPETLRLEGAIWDVKSSPLRPAIHAYTPVGEAADRIAARHYRCNKEVAEGLANGTYDPPEDRGTTGVGQPRESVRQFNEFYRDAKEKAGKPIVV